MIPAGPSVPPIMSQKYLRYMMPQIPPQMTTIHPMVSEPSFRVDQAREELKSTHKFPKPSRGELPTGAE
jgi:hypothetical protein